MVLRLAAALSLAWWTGAALFFTVTSRVPFDVLGRETAGRLATAMFPRYYAWQVAAAAVATTALALLAEPWPAALAAFGGLLALLAGWGVAPRLRSVARGDAAWGRLHAASVVLNLVSLAAGVAALILVVA